MEPQRVYKLVLYISVTSRWVHDRHHELNEYEAKILLDYLRGWLCATLFGL